MFFKDEKTRRSLKAYIKYAIRNSKKTIVTYATVLAGIVFFNLVMSVIVISMASPDSMSNTNSGALMTGFITVSIMAVITSFVWTSREERNKAFTFPVTRGIYAVGNLVSAAFLSFALLVVLSLMSLIELLAGSIISQMNSNLIFMSNITVGNFFFGFAVSYAYLFLFISGAYFVGVYFTKYKVAAWLASGILIAACFFFIKVSPGFTAFLTDAAGFYIFEESIAVCFIKLLITGIILHLGAYLPIRKMEVKI